PNAETVVSACRSQLLAIRGKCNREENIRVANNREMIATVWCEMLLDRNLSSLLEHSPSLAGLGVQQREFAGGQCHRQPLAVARKAEGRGRQTGLFEVWHLLARGHLPQDESAVLVRGRKVFAVGAERQPALAARSR